MSDNINIDKIIKKITDENNNQKIDVEFNSNNNKDSRPIQELDDFEILKYTDESNKIYEENEKKQLKKNKITNKRNNIILWVFAGLSLISVGICSYLGYERHDAHLEYIRVEDIYRKELFDIRGSNNPFEITNPKDPNDVKKYLFKDSEDFCNSWNKWTRDERIGFAYFLFEYCNNLDYSLDKIEEIKQMNDTEWENYINLLKSQKPNWSYKITKTQYIDLVNKESQLKYRDVSRRDLRTELIVGVGALLLFVTIVTTQIVGYFRNKKMSK